ncbi:DUF302 domain-containing protein [Rhodopseudomonas palustris]|nr:DUF302 domain-containing protein [Rhodopseudomonas palustris]
MIGRRKILRWGLIVMMGSAVLIGGARATETKMEVKTIHSAFPFSDTVEKLRTTLEAKGFTIFAAIDQRQAAQSVGLDMPPTTLLIYGNPKGGTPLMLAAPDFALELPLKLLVREDAGSKVLVVYTPAAALEGRHGLPAGLAAKLGGAEPAIAAAVGAPSN